ncbi:FMN-binding protein [Labilibacter sediminis]|nr:FMN-binding protein [Labilibacter sediminis]
MKKYINWLTYISLTIAFIIGYVNFNDNNTEKVNHLNCIVENKLTLTHNNSGTFSAQKKDSLVGYFAIGDAQGYGGPLSVAVLADSSGKIIATELISSYETASFLAKLVNKKYYIQYPEKEVTNRFIIKDDINAVSGATVSSKAIADAVRNASYKIAEYNLNKTTPHINKIFRFTPKEGIALLIFLLGFVAIFIRKKNLKYFSLFLGFIFFGFLFNASLSITHFGRLLLGYFPDIYTHFIWWLLMAGTFTVIIIWGRNLYCNALCPFHATQILLNKISGINLKIPSKVNSLLIKTPNILLWLSLIIIFLSANPTIAAYEPFAMLFSLEGAGIQWYILPASLIGSLFFSNFFCRYFCPVGGAFRWILKVRKQVKLLISNN